MASHPLCRHYPCSSAASSIRPSCGLQRPLAAAQSQCGALRCVVRRRWAAARHQGALEQRNCSCCRCHAQSAGLSLAKIRAPRSDLDWITHLDIFIYSFIHHFQFIFLCFLITFSNLSWLDIQYRTDSICRCSLIFLTFSMKKAFFLLFIFICCKCYL